MSWLYGIRAVLNSLKTTGWPLQALCAVAIVSVTLPTLARDAKLGTLYQPGTPTVIAAERFAALVKERTHDGLNINVFPSAQLGSDEAMLQAMKIGALEFATIGDAQFASYAPKYAFWMLPFVMKDRDHLRRAWNSPIGDAAREEVRRKGGILHIGTIYRSPRLLTANKIIKTPADIVGFKLRTPQRKQLVNIYKGIGFLPTPIAFPEVFGALQQGVIDGQENPLDLIWGEKLYEVQKYVILTEHVQAWNHFLVSERFLNSLSPGDRDIVLQAAKEAVALGNRVQQEQDTALVQKLKDAGATFITPDREAFRRASQNVIQEIFGSGEFAVTWDQLQKM